MYLLFVIIISIGIRLFFLGKNNLLVEEAYYWNYANHLDFSYFDHPPMVALLIKLSTTIFGINEWAIRLPAIICWFFTVLFSFKWSELTAKGSGFYVIFLLSILPFFFLQSLVMTPDPPLMLCWSASLYYLYRTLVLNEKYSWYLAGIWLGLGLLSKYTIVLLGASTLLYLFINPKVRYLLFKKEPYLCAFIALILFTPVIYWNATNQWVSFLFQTSSRFSTTNQFSFPDFLELLFLFLTPAGTWGLWKLIKKNHLLLINKNTILFIKIFTLTPLLLFAIVSCKHPLKFNWIGPSLLALLPWLATLILATRNSKQLNFRKHWLITGIILVTVYGTIFSIANYKFYFPYKEKIFSKYIAWDMFTFKVNQLGDKTATQTQKNPIIIPLDKYNIGSELTFYQHKYLETKEIKTFYPIIGSHVFGQESLMYKYWFTGKLPKNTPLLLISKQKTAFNLPQLKTQGIKQTPLSTLWTHIQGSHKKTIPFYYKIITLNS